MTTTGSQQAAAETPVPDGPTSPHPDGPASPQTDADTNDPAVPSVTPPATVNPGTLVAVSSSQTATEDPAEQLLTRLLQRIQCMGVTQPPEPHAEPGQEAPPWNRNPWQWQTGDQQWDQTSWDQWHASTPQGWTSWLNVRELGTLPFGKRRMQSGTAHTFLIWNSQRLIVEKRHTLVASTR